MELRRIKNEKVIRKIHRCFIRVSEQLIECLKSHQLYTKSCRQLKIVEGQVNRFT